MTPALPDSLALDCVLIASFLLLEVRTGTGVAGASVSSTAGVIFAFIVAGRLLLHAVSHFQRINVPTERTCD